ncbi:sodium:calcium antiporter [Virgibacillus xinjiangensis]|uniref:Sodium:calcium antiporter n=1 Tax=Virgibacillus xinjiangensis TaxID=393090 RepID=A0ABV7CQS0_9BACI
MYSVQIPFHGRFPENYCSNLVILTGNGECKHRKHFTFAVRHERSRSPINSVTLLVIFIISAILSVFAATQLSKYANIISHKAKLGGFLAGTLLLSIATSLPELTATISASVIGNADIVIGNGVGSILFNMFVLFLLDVHFRKKRLFLTVSHNHLYTGYLALFLCVLITLGLGFDFDVSLFELGFTSLALVTVYLVGMKFLSGSPQEEDKPDPVTTSGLGSAIRRFLLFAVIIFITGSSLSVTGDAISRETAISATAVGSLMIALATSLPDAASVYTALRLSNMNLAVGTLLGSNAFNITILAAGDFFYPGGNMWQAASDDLLYLSIIGFLLTTIVMVTIKRDRTRNMWTYLLPSSLALASYVAVVGYILTS